MNISQLQTMMDDAGIEMIINQECISPQRIAEGIYRVASYECDEYGSTYFSGTVNEIEKYVRNITGTVI